VSVRLRLNELTRGQKLQSLGSQCDDRKQHHHLQSFVWPEGQSSGLQGIGREYNSDFQFESRSVAERCHHLSAATDSHYLEQCPHQVPSNSSITLGEIAGIQCSDQSELSFLAHPPERLKGYGWDWNEFGK
jgi:hypothetical protein